MTQISRSEACDLIRDVINQLQDEKIEKIDIPAYVIENKNDPICIKNVNFSSNCASNKNNEDYEYWKQQRLENGFDDTELWDLYQNIAGFIYPRLIRFKETIHGFPAKFETIDKWNDALDEMIFAFKYYSGQFEDLNIDDEGKFEEKDGKTVWVESENSQRAKKGLNLFAEYFSGIWD